MSDAKYDPKDEIPVLEKMKAAGWIKEYSENRQISMWNGQMRVVEKCEIEKFIRVN